MNKNINKMAEMNMNKLIVVMSLPAITSMLVQALYNVIDSIFIAQIGSEALTALSIAFPVQMLMVAVATGLSIGINSYVSRKIGEKEMDEAASAAEHGIIMAVLCWGLLVLLNYLFINKYINIYTTDTLTIKYTLQYVNIVVYASLGFILSMILMSIQQATGDMVSSMKIQIIGAVINLVLDPIMIFGWLIIPSMGVVGGALATVIGQTISMLYALSIVKHNPLKLTLSKLHVNFKTDKNIVKEILKVGVPSMFVQGLATVMISAVNLILVGLSGVAVAALGAFFKIYAIIVMPVIGLTQGMMPVVGFNYGAKNKDRVISAIKYSVLYTISFMALGSVFFIAFAEQIMRVFSDVPELVSVGVTCIRVISITFAIMGCSIVIISAFQAFGIAWLSLVSSFLRQILLLLPLAYFLSKYYGVVGVWVAFPITEVISLALTIAFALKIYRDTVKPRLASMI